MALYDWSTGNLPPAKITDADGVEWKNVVWCNTVTGILEVQVTDSQDQFILENGSIKVETFLVTPPLEVTFEKRYTS